MTPSSSWPTIKVHGLCRTGAKQLEDIHDYGSQDAPTQRGRLSVPQSRMLIGGIMAH